MSPNSCERDSPGDLMEQKVQSAALSTLESITREAQVWKKVVWGDQECISAIFPAPGSSTESRYRKGSQFR